jgi:hypothetical protein
MASLAVAAVTCVFALGKQGAAFASDGHHGFLGGPWELVVKLDMEGQGLRFPIAVSDENKPAKLDGILPVMGTPIKVRVEQYLPNLEWETTAVKESGGGIVAKLVVEGPAMEQDVWLSSSDQARQSISSSIGGVSIRALQDAETAEKLIGELTAGEAVGILSVWTDDNNKLFEYVAKPAEMIIVPNSKYKLSVLEYLPHYSIDTETKKVTNLSDRPINPAIKVSVMDGGDTYERWLWSKFPSSPHREAESVLRMTFADLNLGGAEGQYFLITSSGSEPWLVFSKEDRTIVQKANMGEPYPFLGDGYSFRIERIFHSAIIKSDWKNESERLLNPAVVAAVEHNGMSQQLVLELNQTRHYNTKHGTIALLYRRCPDSRRGQLN